MPLPPAAASQATGSLPTREEVDASLAREKREWDEAFEARQGRSMWDREQDAFETGPLPPLTASHVGTVFVPVTGLRRRHDLAPQGVVAPRPAAGGRGVRGVIRRIGDDGTSGRAA